MGPAPGLRSLVGEALTPPDFATRFARYGWRPSFWALARISAWIANAGGVGGKQLRALGAALRNTAASGSLREQGLADALARAGDIPTAHEAAVYFLQALALMHGSEDDSARMGDAELAFFLLAANDYVFAWRVPDERTLSREESAMAECGRALLYNRDRDEAAEIVRGASILEQTPRRTPRWASETAWGDLQRRAFGVGLRTYVDSFAAPLALTSRGWEAEFDSQGSRGPPILDLRNWTRPIPIESDLVSSYWNQLVTSRDEARASLLADANVDGLPIGCTTFIHKPFVRFAPQRVVAASPWLVRNHLRYGLWARMGRAAAAEEERKHSKDWPYAFGDLVEQWCQRVARIAEGSPRFVGRVITGHPDDDEIEDIVIVQNRKVALISVKGTVLREDLLKGARCRSRTADFYHQFLFGAAKGNYRMGAVRLLDAKITRLRAGGYEPDVSRHSKVYPIVVTFDEMGIDSPGGYDFLIRYSKDANVLQDRRVLPVTCLAMDSFETLLAYCAKGHSLFDILDKKTSRPWATGRLDGLLQELSGSSRHRLPQIEAEFAERAARMTKLLGEQLERTRTAKTGRTEEG